MNEAIVRPIPNGELLAKLDAVKKLFSNWIFPSIESSYRATKQSGGGTPLVVFILISCAIDVIAGFYCGRTSYKGLGKQYKKFIDDYFPKKYSSKKVYENIRCSLVHNFIVGPNMALTHGNPQVHLITQNGVDFKNLENFFEDFKNAVAAYYRDLESSEKLQEKFLQRFNKFKISAVQIFMFSHDRDA